MRLACLARAAIGALCLVRPLTTSSCARYQGVHVRTLDFLLRQAAQAIDAFFFAEPPTGDNGPDAFNCGAGANLRG